MRNSTKIKNQTSINYLIFYKPEKLTKKEFDMKMLRYKVEKRQGTMEDMAMFRDAILPKKGSQRYNCFDDKLPDESLKLFRCIYRKCG